MLGCERCRVLEVGFSPLPRGAENAQTEVLLQALRFKGPSFPKPKTKLLQAGDSSAMSPLSITPSVKLSSDKFGEVAMASSDESCGAQSSLRLKRRRSPQSLQDIHVPICSTLHAVCEGTIKPQDKY